MDLFDNSILKWDQPESYYKYKERQIKRGLPKWRWILGVYILPIFGPGLLVAILGIIFGSLKTFLFGIFICAVCSLALLKRHKKVTIRLYKNKVSVYEDDVRKKNLKFKDIETFNIEVDSEDNEFYNILVLLQKSGKKFSYVLDPAVDKEELVELLNSESLRLKLSGTT